MAEKLLKVLANLEALESQSSRSFSEQKQAAQLISSKELNKQLEALKQEKQLLKIGVIGRVKAGKSSLLNALVFDANNVLPEAATPMTAALTIIKYGEEFGAQIDTFSAEDEQDFKQQANEYKKALEKISQSHKDELIASAAKNEGVKQLSPARIAELEPEIDKKARFFAQNELLDKREDLVAASMQYEQMKGAAKPSQTRISAANLDELKQKLQDYVGAQGKYTAYTKSITLQLNEPNLKGIEIIDTPGVCDPVASRGARTAAMLKTCHVAFLVCPAGQFLTADDTGLILQIYGANETELIAVASKADSELYGSEKTDGGGVLARVLDSLESKLNKRLKNFCAEQASKQPEQKSLWDRLAKSKVLLSSGLAHKILRQSQQLSAYEAQTLANYEKHYPAEFAQDKAAALAALANVSQLRAELERVRQNRDQIIQDKNDNLVRIELKNAQNYAKLVLAELQAEIETLKTTNINNLQKEKARILSKQSEAKSALEQAYKSCLEGFDERVKAPVASKLALEFKKSQRKVNSSEKTTTKSEQYTETEYKYETSWLRSFGSWFGFCDEYERIPVIVTKIRSYEVVTVSSNMVFAALESTCERLQALINEELKRALNDFAKDCSKQVKAALKAVLAAAEPAADADDADGELIDLDAISLDSVTQAFRLPAISLAVPAALKARGTISDEAAKKYLEAAREFLAALESGCAALVEGELESKRKELAAYDLSEAVLAKYRAKIDELEQKLSDKEGEISKCKRLQDAYENALR